MNLRDAVAAARELGCDVKEPKDNDTHYRITHREVHPGRVLTLSGHRQDTPWTAFQWLRDVFDYYQKLAIQRQRDIDDKKVDAAVSAYRAIAITLDSETADDIRDPERILQDLRDAKLNAAAAQQVMTDSGYEIANAKAIITLAEERIKTETSNMNKANKRVEALLKELDAAVAEEVASITRG